MIREIFQSIFTKAGVKIFIVTLAFVFLIIVSLSAQDTSIIHRHYFDSIIQTDTSTIYRTYSYFSFYVVNDNDSMRYMQGIRTDSIKRPDGFHVSRTKLYKGRINMTFTAEEIEELLRGETKDPEHEFNDEHKQ